MSDDATATGEMTDAPVALSPGVAVVLRREGLQLAGLTVPVLRVDRHVLGLLLAVADGTPLEVAADQVGRSGAVGPARLERLLAALADGGGLVPAEAAPPPRRLDVAPRPAPDRPPDGDTEVCLEVPTMLAVTDEGFALVDHDGVATLVLDPDEVVAAGHLCTARRYADARVAHRRAVGTEGLDDEGFDRLAGVLGALGVLRVLAPDTPAWESGTELQAVIDDVRKRSYDRLVAASSRWWDATRAEAANDRRTQVVPVSYADVRLPLALGAITAFAMAHDGGRLQEHYRFERCWAVDDHVLDTTEERPAVFLFSNYLWSHGECLRASARVKERRSGNITIHGGPNTPKYEGDVEAYFAAHPHVDITVRGEGEATTAAILEALVGAIGPDGADLSVLADVAGLSYRDGDRVVHTPERDRIAVLDDIPSPYLTGLFDDMLDAEPPYAVIETNRGCPYRCTFCDWGSATMSRIRQFSLERVTAELEWCAANGIGSINVADANFGIYKRDVEIAEAVVALNERYGVPKQFGVNFAKNTAKHLTPIIEMMVGAGIVTEGILSLQSMDTETLQVIDRSNIKLEKYEELAAQFRRAHLPLHVDIMMGLPGQSLRSFRADLQQCIDREVAANVPPTQLLVNSPMNRPDYKSTHAIEVRANGAVVATATFTRDDYAQMVRLRRAFYLFDNFGVLRQVSRWVRQETGIEEMVLYERVLAAAADEPTRWPTITLAIDQVSRSLTAPVSWRHFVDEVRELLVTVVGVPADDALETVLAVQHALLPSRHRGFPTTVELAHDYAAWHADVIRAKDAGALRSWVDEVARLATYPPGTLRVDDPGQVTRAAFGSSIDSYGFGLSWELDSPVNRPSNFTTAVRELLS